MIQKNFLLVCEGETDVYVFQALADHFSSEKLSFKIIPLSPQRDATSGTYSSHSFGAVLNWCTVNKNRLQMLIDFNGAKALFVQLDTDIAKQINPHCTQNTPPRNCCEERINKEFGVTAEPPDCYYILPTQNTETWLLAAENFSALNEKLEPIENYELISDTEQRLIALGFSSKKGKNSNQRKLNKPPATKYKNYSSQLIKNLNVARVKCSELDRLCTLLNS